MIRFSYMNGLGGAKSTKTEQLTQNSKLKLAVRHFYLLPVRHNLLPPWEMGSALCWPRPSMGEATLPTCASTVRM